MYLKQLTLEFIRY